MVELMSDNVRLREYVKTEYLRLVKLSCEPEFSTMYMFGQDHKIGSFFRKSLRRQLRLQKMNPRFTRQSYEFGIENNGEFCGIFELDVSPEGLTDPQEGKWDVGRVSYYVAKEHRRRGVATTALQQIIDFSFNNLRLGMLVAYSLKENGPSNSLLDKVGFKVENEGQFELSHGRDSFEYTMYSDDLIFSQ